MRMCCVINILFRHGLGNSIYCPPHNLNVIGEDQVSCVQGCYGDDVILH